MRYKTKLRALRSILLMTMLSLGLVNCSDDEKPKAIPSVNTAALTDIGTTSATGGGEVTDNGNAAIAAVGLVYSSTNGLPTLADSKTEEVGNDGVFTSNLVNLSSGTTYYVRAYATNSVGTGYGPVVDFTTGNAAPTVNNVSISGTVEVNRELEASYTYVDPEGDIETGSTLQWYVADDGGGAGEAAIAGATSLTYTPKDTDEFKFIRVGVTPKAATGTTPGVEVKSDFYGPIAVRTTVTFTYNGQEVTYGIVVSPVTQRKWLDRNLGAPNTPAAYNDYENYGDSFQWGRGDDGHQLVSRASTSTDTKGVNSTTTTLSNSDNPGHNSFILLSADPYDWRDPQNDNLWQGMNGINNPCPEGWRIPTINEWELEEIVDIADGYTKIKLTAGGQRSGTSGGFSGTPSNGFYWSSTIPSPGAKPQVLNPSTLYTSTIPYIRSQGLSCRCIKD